MTDEDKVLLSVALGLGILAFIAARRSSSGLAGYTEQDVDHLARTIWAETSVLGLPGRRSEFEAIGQVGINRARINNISLVDTLRPPGRPLWNGSGTFRQRWNDAPNEPRFNTALEISRQLLSGEAPNLIGDRMQFVHPSGSPRCANDSSCKGRRMCVDGRCIPIWSIAARDGGNAPHEPIRIGRAIVS